ncbi:MAG TPA: hypothetical protein VFI54_15380, partial [Solirubrobacteraceae bacterium]|nr:hypothetical protein [Solirubrobacteraceae bacterium]
TARRLRRVEALHTRPPHRQLALRWLRLEHALAAVYARSYVRIFDAIAAANTPIKRARLPRILHDLVRAPDPARRRAAVLERELLIPDCTGGGNGSPTTTIITGQP